jgi:glyoxylase-like metal-dependent hydrolase (beta-lactamase superfamily II)
MAKNALRLMLALAVPGLIFGQAFRSHGEAGKNLSNTEVHVLPVQGNIYMLVGAGGNTTVQVGSQGVLVVDTQFAPMAPKILAAIKTLSDKPIRYIINTNSQEDHTGGNEALHKAGVTITGANVAADIGDARDGAAVLAHENVLTRMSAPEGSKPAAPSAAWPTDTFLGKEKALYFNGESVEILHEPDATTDGDSLVYFRRSDVVSAGDLFNTDGYPVIDLEKGGTIQGVINGLDHLLALTVVAHEEEGGTLVIPGHGRLCDQADVVEYRDMVAIVRDRIKDSIKRGETLEQVLAERPTKEYDGLYGKNEFWTPNMFVTAAYKSLSPVQAKK